jgi:hypothetical protein
MRSSSAATTKTTVVDSDALIRRIPLAFTSFNGALMRIPRLRRSPRISASLHIVFAERTCKDNRTQSTQKSAEGSDILHDVRVKIFSASRACSLPSPATCCAAFISPDNRASATIRGSGKGSEIAKNVQEPQNNSNDHNAIRIDLMVPYIEMKRLISHKRKPTTISTRTIPQDLLRNPHDVRATSHLDAQRGIRLRPPQA